MGQKPKISFIGSGNLAWHLAPALDNVGYTIHEVYSKNGKNAKALVNRLYQASVKKTLDFSTSDSSIFVVAVPDKAIAEVAKEIVLPPNSILLHTSGSQPLRVLDYAAADYIGVFYPLQTFTKGVGLSFDTIPILIEAPNPKVGSLLSKMGHAISSEVRQVDTAGRAALHVAAVFACNFTNHLYYISQQLVEGGSLDFGLLAPLITETLRKAISNGPGQSQTGPAARHDLETLEKHMAFLSGQEAWSSIYKAITQDILDRY